MSVQKLLQIARNQIGVSELTKKNDGEPSLRYMGGREEPWCAHFVAWCYRNAGMVIPDDILPSKKQHNPLASVTHMERIFLDHEWCYREPREGDVVFFKSRGKSDAGSGRHCGIVESVDAGKRTFSTIEGNLSNKVGRMTYRYDSSYVSSFGRLPESK